MALLGARLDQLGAFLVAGGSGLAYVGTAARAWMVGVVAGAVYAIPLLVVWIDLAEVFTGSN